MPSAPLRRVLCLTANCTQDKLFPIFRRVRIGWCACKIGEGGLLSKTDLLVEGVEVEVENGRRVSRHQRPSAHEPSGLVVRQHRERPASALSQCPKTPRREMSRQKQASTRSIHAGVAVLLLWWWLRWLRWLLLFLSSSSSFVTNTPALFLQFHSSSLVIEQVRLLLMTTTSPLIQQKNRTLCGDREMSFQGFRLRERSPPPTR